jgi:UDP-N-acetylglucosamine 2-epimerase (non-hydrolysing)
MKRVLAVVGTRPEAIKMLPVVQALRRRIGLELILVSTAQHKEMLDQVFEAFGEVPDLTLDVMRAGQDLTDITVRVLEEMRTAIGRLAPDLLLVHGDTTTAMASGLAGFYARVPVGHVEAGLRSHDTARPWPEEYNRVAIDSYAELLFAPTEVAAANLRRERPTARGVFVTGNTGIDALLAIAGRLKGDEVGDALDGLDPEAPLVLVTGHRRESFGDGFARICDGIGRIARRGNVSVVYPVHLNPQVRGVVMERLGAVDNVRLIDPVPYPQMVALMQRSAVILTDSGGIQEEAPALGKPVLVMRDVTERPEAVETGVVSLVGTDPGRMDLEVHRMLTDPAYYASRARKVFPYGDGTAAEKIADAILNFLRDK